MAIPEIAACCFGGQAEEAWRKEVGALPTKEWIILTHKPSDASWVAGLSACLPDEVRDTRKLDSQEKAGEHPRF